MTFDRDSVLRPLRACAADLSALRGGADGHIRSRAVVRVGEAAETSLRRFLRDDPTVPVELRLRALSPDDLAVDELLAELRRRNRLPMELAAAFHELDAAAARIAAGSDATPRDAELANAVADGLDRHLMAMPAGTPMEDPVTEPEETRLTANDEAEGGAPVRPVPPASWARSLRLAGGALALLAVAVLGWLAWRGSQGDDELRRGEEYLRAGRTVAAAEVIEGYARENPREALPRIYLGRIYRETGRYADAGRELRAGLRDHPQEPRLLTEMGYLLLETGRPADAVRSFRGALDADREATTAWVGLVRAIRATGNEAAARQALAGAPEEVRALLSRAEPMPAPMAPAPAPGQVPGQVPGQDPTALPPATAAPAGIPQ